MLVSESGPPACCEHANGPDPSLVTRPSEGLPAILREPRQPAGKAPMKTRTLKSGRTVALHDNNGLRKRCGCPRRKWASCSHPWHFSFKWKDTHHRFPLDKYAEHPIRTKDDARTEAERLRIAIRGGNFPPVSVNSSVAATAADLTFETFGEKWREHGRADQSDSQKANEKAYLKQLCVLKVSDAATLGQFPIGRITEDDVETAFQALTTLAGSTWNKYRQVIIGMQRWGTKKGYLMRPWLSADSAIERKRNARRARRLVPDLFDEKGKLVQPGEERRLLDKAGPWLQRLIIAALETGCRRGELLSLQWRDVDLIRGELTIRAENAKDNESRHLPISSRLKAVLKMVQHDPKGEEHKPHAFVFGDAVGGKVADPKKSWAKAVKAAGISDLHFHDLRHEAGSRFVEQGWPLHHVREMLGHADLKTTDNYINTTRQGLHDSMRKFGTPSLHHVAHRLESEPQPPCNDEESAAGKSLVN
jgi:integrase